MDGPAAIGRNVVAVPAGLTRRREAFGLSSLKRHSVKITLDRVVGRCAIVKPAVLVIDHVDLNDVEIAVGDSRKAFAVGACEIGVPPTVAFAQPNKQHAAPLRTHAHGVFVFQPGRIGLGEHLARLAGLRVRQQNQVSVLQAVELLDEEFRSVRRPLHLGKVMVARIARDIEPACFAIAAGVDNAEPRRRIFSRRPSDRESRWGASRARPYC